VKRWAKRPPAKCVNIIVFPARKVVVMSEVIVKVKCVGCGAKKDIRAGEIASGDHPMCDICFMPMVPVSAGKKK
jgi:hypothetical protein